jgi:hypothetical protein
MESKIIQHYPPGTQENYSKFPSRNLMMKKGTESEFPEGLGGLESASRILMKGSGIREADSNDRGVPPKIIRLRKCRGGLPSCKNAVGDYKDIDDVGCCQQCDQYIDENPYDPYWEQMEQLFEDSKEYEELEKSGNIENMEAYEKAFEKYQASYEPWPDMRRRMAKRSNA